MSRAGKLGSRAGPTGGADPIAIRDLAGGGVALAVKAQPRARRAGLAGLWNGFLRVAVREPAEGGRANAAVLAEVARALGVPARSVSLVSGAASPRKVVAVLGLTAPLAEARLRAALAEES